MIPNINILTEEITETTYPNKTYQIIASKEVDAESGDNVNRISGYVDDLESIKQAIYLILSTERYKFIIYSWDYGVELIDLIGQPMPYVMSELPRRIRDALIQDNRIDDVVDFEFEKQGNKLHTTFTVVTNVGNIPTELEVEV